MAVLKCETKSVTSYKNVELYCLDDYALISGLIERERVAVCVRFRRRSDDSPHFRTD